VFYSGQSTSQFDARTHAIVQRLRKRLREEKDHVTHLETRYEGLKEYIEDDKRLHKEEVERLEARIRDLTIELEIVRLGGV
jgi:predicted RNase H-like nuclease (RuvC/YqgF family)